VAASPAINSLISYRADRDPANQIGVAPATLWALKAKPEKASLLSVRTFRAVKIPGLELFAGEKLLGHFSF